MKLETRLFIADLTHLDCAYFDPDLGLTGETWRVDAELGGELADDGMLCDFGIIKSTLKRALDAQTDHRLLLSAGQAALLQAQGGHRELQLSTRAGERWRYLAPLQSFALLDVPALAPATLATELERQLLTTLPANITSLRLQLSPAHEQGPYRYCHGLRQHEGNCQRMAHGHRARLEISLDGTRVASLEEHWQQRLEGRYIGSAADLRSRPAGRHCFAYSGSQGEFELEMPQQRSYVIDAEPTVESISAHMARQIASEHPGRKVQCRAFEGIGKGAVSCACA